FMFNDYMRRKTDTLCACAVGGNFHIAFLAGLATQQPVNDQIVGAVVELAREENKKVTRKRRKAISQATTQTQKPHVVPIKKTRVTRRKPTAVETKPTKTKTRVRKKKNAS